ncbi:AraC family transcriptional regulator [Solirubrobacter soli]|uniref:AraC family transcriptional regulator n=1 Tax=Solirubrobacter soli TaxID=363832 RepID=UPI00041D0CF6|nr:AraC family transcriptional regulator [Solirubrobacter soli]
MLSSAALLTTPDLRVRDLHCAHARGGWCETEISNRAAIIFPRRGSFRRRGAHGDEVIEPGVAYFQRAGEEEEFAHPHDGGDRCTSVGLSDRLIAQLLGGDPTLPGRLVATTPHDDLVVRTLGVTGEVAELCHGTVGDPTRHEERVIGLVASVLAAAVPKRAAANRPSTAQARRRAASDAREALAADPSLGLLALAQAVAVSPHHLSRVFKAELGVSITTYRRRLRLRAALERIDEGGLARVAADAGFADHAHFTREVRALLGTTPSALQREIAGPLHQSG